MELQRGELFHAYFLQSRLQGFVVVFMCELSVNLYTSS